MNLKDMSKEELESMSYDDLAYALLTEKKEQMKIIDLFNEIGKLIKLPASVIEEEKRIEMGKEDLANKPEAIREKIVAGRIDKLMAQRCLLDQAFVKDPNQTVSQLIEGKLSVVRFERYVLGEGLEKRQENFADEVMSQIKG